MHNVIKNTEKNQQLRLVCKMNVQRVWPDVGREPTHEVKINPEIGASNIAAKVEFYTVRNVCP